MQKPKLFFSAIALGSVSGTCGGYLALNDRVAAYSTGFLGAAAGFLLWLLIAYLVDSDSDEQRPRSVD